MSQNIYLKFDGIDGESTHTHHRDEIEVLEWDHGFDNLPSTSTGSRRRRSRARKLETVFIHHFDKASPVLMQRCLSGTIISDATLSVISTTGQAQSICTLKIEMKGVTIVRLESSVLSGEDKMVENVTLDYKEIEIEYVQIDSSGHPTPSISSGWNFQTNTTR